MNTRRAARATARVVAATAVVGAILLAPRVEPAGAHTPHDVAPSTAFSPDFAQDRTVYTVVREMLLKSTDGGQTWSRRIKGLDGGTLMSSVAVDPTDASHVYVATRGNGVFASTDAGASWRPTGDLTPASRSLLHLEVSPLDGDTLFGLNPAGGVVSTTDGAKQWTVVAPLAETEVTSLRIADDDKGTVLAGSRGRVATSTDGGDTWARRDVGTDDAVTAIAVSPEVDDDGTIYLGFAKEGIRRSTDHGRTFANASSGLTDRRIGDLAIPPDASDASTVFASTWNDGVFRSTDGARRWSRAADGLTTNEQADLLGRPQFTALAISPAVGDADRVMFADGFDGLFRSTDAASSWKEVTTQDATNIAGFALSPGYERDGTIAIVTYINGAYRSTDRGRSWTPINTGLAASYEWLRRADYVNRLTTIAFSPTYADDSTIYASGRGYWFESSSSGDVWHASTPEGLLVPGQFPPGYLIPAFSPTYAKDRTTVAGTSTGLLLRTNPAGVLVRRQRIPAVVTAMAVSPAFDRDRIVLAATSKGVFRSTDAGRSYRQAKSSPGNILNVAVSSGFGSDGRAWVGTKAGLWETTDRGATWSPVTGGPFAGAYVEAFVTSPDFATDGVALASVRGKGLYRSTDGARTFRPIATDLIDDNIQFASWYHPSSAPIQFSPSFASDRTVFAISGSLLYRSTDAGDTWTPLPFDRFTHPVTAASAPNTLLETPRPQEPAPTITTPGAPAPDVQPSGVGPRDATPHPVLIITTRRVAAATAVAVIAFAAMWLLRIGTRTSRRRLEVALYIGWGLVAFAVVFFVLTSR